MKVPWKGSDVVRLSKGTQWWILSRTPKYRVFMGCPSSSPLSSYSYHFCCPLHFVMMLSHCVHAAPVFRRFIRLALQGSIRLVAVG